MLLKNDLKQSDLCSMNLLLKNIYTHTAMYHFGLNKGQFLFDSIIIYTKFQSSFTLQVFWAPVVLSFSLSNIN